jgi:zinc resistance-associated protein
MWKAGLAGVVALVIGSSVACAGSGEVDFGRSSPAVAQSGVTMSLAQVSRLKSVLKLTATQEQLWPAIERAFHEISQAQETAGSQGFVQGVKSRAASIGLNALALRRLASAAYPLIRTLDEDQKQSALAFARSAGLHSVAAAF